MLTHVKETSDAVAEPVRITANPRGPLVKIGAKPGEINTRLLAAELATDASMLTESSRIEVGAAGPHGLALLAGRLFCAADAGELVVIDRSDHGHRVARRLPLRGAPDVVMLDLRMPPTFTDEGLQAAEHIRAAHPDVAVLLLSQYADIALAAAR